MRHSSVGCTSRAVSAVAVAAALVSGFGGAARAAAPEPRPVTLTWDAPAGCPTADEVLDDVDRNLPEPGAGRTPLTATVRVSAGPGQVWQASLTLDVRGARTQRRFNAESCGAIAAASAIIIAIAVEDASEAPPDPTPALPEQDGEKTPPLTAPATSRQGAFRPFLMANGLVDWDTMPSAPAAGFEIAVGWGRSAARWRLRWLAGAELFPSHPPGDTPYLGRVDGAFWMLGVSGRGCLAVALSRLEIGPCLGAELVGMHASNGGNVDPEARVSLANQTHYWLSLLGSIAASWNVSGAMDVVLRADLVVPTSRRVFGLEDNVLDDYQVPARALRGALGIQVRFP